MQYSKVGFGRRIPITMPRLISIFLLLLTTFAFAKQPQISPPSPHLQKQLNLSPFYKKSPNHHRPPKDSKLTGKQYWDRRARGLGGTRADPLTSCGEENLLNLKGDPYAGENILIHEFSHIIQNVAIRNTDPDLHQKITVAWNQAKSEGLW